MPTAPKKVTVKKGAAKTKPAATKSTGGRAKKDAEFSNTYSFDNETPGTFRFGEDADKDDLTVPTIYVRKDKALELFGKQPKGLTVTITPIF